jgi:hypothetical protein
VWRNPFARLPRLDFQQEHRVDFLEGTAGSAFLLVERCSQENLVGSRREKGEKGGQEKGGMANVKVNLRFRQEEEHEQYSKEVARGEDITIRKADGAGDEGRGEADEEIE